MYCCTYMERLIVFEWERTDTSVCVCVCLRIHVVLPAGEFYGNGGWTGRTGNCLSVTVRVGGDVKYTPLADGAHKSAAPSGADDGLVPWVAGRVCVCGRDVPTPGRDARGGVAARYVRLKASGPSVGRVLFARHLAIYLFYAPGGLATTLSRDFCRRRRPGRPSPAVRTVDRNRGTARDNRRADSLPAARRPRPNWRPMRRLGSVRRC